MEIFCVKIMDFFFVWKSCCFLCENYRVFFVKIVDYYLWKLWIFFCENYGRFFFLPNIVNYFFVTENYWRFLEIVFFVRWAATSSTKGCSAPCRPGAGKASGSATGKPSCRGYRKTLPRIQENLAEDGGQAPLPKTGASQRGVPTMENI